MNEFKFHLVNGYPEALTEFQWFAGECNGKSKTVGYKMKGREEENKAKEGWKWGREGG